MKIFGHPIHVLLIHFPAALLPMDLALSLFSYIKNDSTAATAGFYSLFVGVLVGIFAMLTGLWDLIKIPRSDKAALTTGIYHGFINGVVILFFAILAYSGLGQYPDITIPSLGTIILKVILVLVLFVGNYMGGKLIYKHHIGIK